MAMTCVGDLMRQTQLTQLIYSFSSGDLYVICEYHFVFDCRPSIAHVQCVCIVCAQWWFGIVTGRQKSAKLSGGEVTDRAYVCTYPLLAKVADSESLGRRVGGGSGWLSWRK